MRSVILIVMCLGIGLAACESRAQEVRISLTQPDEFAARDFAVVRMTGAAVPGLLDIVGFDRARRAFVFTDVSGRRVGVPLSDIAAIEFRQRLAQQSPQAQEPPWRVETTQGTPRTLAIPSAQLRLGGGILTVQGLPARNAALGERWEAQSLRYDPRTSVFTLSVVPVTYRLLRLGGGGSSGMMKGLP